MCVRTTKGNSVSSLSGAQSSFFFFLGVCFPSLSQFLIFPAWLTVVTPLVLLTDSSSSVAWLVIKSCHGYHSERMDKCAMVAGHRGSQVNAPTKLEEDTAKEERERRVRHKSYIKQLTQSDREYNVLYFMMWWKVMQVNWIWYMLLLLFRAAANDNFNWWLIWSLTFYIQVTVIEKEHIYNPIM